MKYILKTRRTGKTTELVRMAAEKGLYILCLDKYRVKNIEQIARELNVAIRFPITVAELPIKSPFINKILVDDADEVLRAILQKDIEALTMSVEE